MAVKTTYSHARANLATLWEEVEDSREAAVIERRGHEDMALIPAAELASLRETAYLFRCPANAARLLAALTRARRGRSRSTDPAARSGSRGATKTPRTEIRSRPDGAPPAASERQG
jgi:antitoxin YefM